MKKKQIQLSIIVISILIPSVVAFLIYTQGIFEVNKKYIGMLPPFHAILNSLTVIALIFSLYFIKKKKITLHKKANWTAVSLSSIFLISYVIYHGSAESTFFGDSNKDGLLSVMEIEQVGLSRYGYLFLLISHILLAIIIVPLVLFAIYFAYCKDFQKHKKIVRYTYPIWMYVALSGVWVYILLIPYYD